MNLAMISAYLTLCIAQTQTASVPPKVGEKAPAFEVTTLDHRAVSSNRILRSGPMVLVLLRGYPGYQCPFCTRQVGELIEKADEFAKRKATVVLVYPGPADQLSRYATEFMGGKNLPSNFRFTLDPGFKFTETYHLRWDAPGETAFPSTFVVGREGKVVYAKVSRSHGDRAPLAEVLAALPR